MIRATDDGREVAKAVAIATLTAVATGLVSIAIDEIKARRASGKEKTK